MDKALPTTPTIHAAAAVSQRAVVGRIVRVLGFSALIAMGAQVRIPVPGTDVPMTLQLLAVLLAGLLLDWRDVAASLGLYLVAGAAGLPAFAPGSAGLFGPTGGYLVGFLPAGVLIAATRGTSVVRMVLPGLAGVAIVLGCGVLGRVIWLAGDESVAFSTGFWPFWSKALVELAVAVALVRAVRTGRNG